MKLIATERRQKISHALRLAPVLRYNRMKMIISRRTKISTNLLKTPTHPTGGNCCRTIHVLLIAQKLGTQTSPFWIYWLSYLKAMITLEIFFVWISKSEYRKWICKLWFLKWMKCKWCHSFNNNIFIKSKNRY